MNHFYSFISIFLAVFLAELADKTQIATFTFASNPAASKLNVFFASASALVISSALAVFAASTIGPLIERFPVGRISGLIFIVIGIFMFLRD